jgi:serine/threonine protein phosphatase 1
LRGFSFSDHGAQPAARLPFHGTPALKISLQFEFVREGERWYPSLPEGIRVYAIGDIHGRLDLLNECLCQIDEDLARNKIGRSIQVFLGDYIDRGPSSRETVDRLIERGSRYECVFLKGNHEQLALRSLTDVAVVPKWLHLGGLETLVSYGISATMSGEKRDVLAAQSSFQDALPASHFQFFENLKTHFCCGSYFFAHAGVKPGVELPKQSVKDLLWIRDEFLSSTVDFGMIVVHGHTPTPRVNVRSNQINIDTGAYASDLLSCLVLDGDQLSIIDSSVTN